MIKLNVFFKDKFEIVDSSTFYGKFLYMLRTNGCDKVYISTKSNEEELVLSYFVKKKKTKNFLRIKKEEINQYFFATGMTFFNADALGIDILPHDAIKLVVKVHDEHSLNIYNEIVYSNDMTIKPGDPVEIFYCGGLIGGFFGVVEKIIDTFSSSVLDLLQDHIEYCEKIPQELFSAFYDYHFKNMARTSPDLTIKGVREDVFVSFSPSQVFQLIGPTTYDQLASTITRLKDAFACKTKEYVDINNYYIVSTRDLGGLSSEADFLLYALGPFYNILGTSRPFHIWSM